MAAPAGRLLLVVVGEAGVVLRHLDGDDAHHHSAPPLA